MLEHNKPDRLLKPIKQIEGEVVDAGLNSSILSLADLPPYLAANRNFSWHECCHCPGKGEVPAEAK
jgi:hypothetical protein